MKYEAIVMHSASTINSPVSSNIMDFLELIAPEKRNWWASSRQDRLTVDFRTDLRLQGIHRQNDVDLIGDPDTTMTAIKSRFGLKQVVIAGLGGYRGDFAGDFNKRSFNGILLTPAEAGRLYEAICGKSFDNVRYIEVHLGSESIIRVRAPGGSRVKDIVSYLSDSLPETKIPPENQVIFNPLTRRELDPEEIIGPESDVIAIAEEMLRLDVVRSGILKRPSARRKLSYRNYSEALDTRRPCCNCLACSSVCPAGLSPSILFHFAESGAEDLDSLGADLCFQCGLCTHVCPSNIPLSTGIGGINDDAS